MTDGDPRYDAPERVSARREAQLEREARADRTRVNGWKAAGTIAIGVVGGLGVLRRVLLTGWHWTDLGGAAVVAALILSGMWLWHVRDHERTL